MQIYGMVTRDKQNIAINISEDDLVKRMEQIESANIDEELRKFLLDALYALVRLDELVGMKETTILRLRKIFNKKTEKSARESTSKNASSEDKPHPRGNNNGRNGQTEYPHAERVFHPHETLGVESGVPVWQR
jgi:hypothetical protein